MHDFIKINSNFLFFLVIFLNYLKLLNSFMDLINQQYYILKLSLASHLINYIQIFNIKITMEEKTIYKKIKQYLISLQEKHYLGKGRLGEVREGYNQTSNKILLFKIMNLPISPKIMENFQKHMKLNSDYLQHMYDPVNSSTKCYVPYQFLPKILSESKNQYKQNIEQMTFLLTQILESYSYLYFVGIGHGNIKITNIGFDSQNKLKLMDLIYSSSFQNVIERDMTNLGMVLYSLYHEQEFEQQKNKRNENNELSMTMIKMIKKQVSWQQLFEKYKIINKFTRIVKQLNYNVQNRVVVLTNICKQLKKIQSHAYLKISIYKFIKNLIQNQLNTGNIQNKKYQQLLKIQSQRLSNISKKLNKKRYVGVKDLINKHTYFQLHKRIAFCVLSCFHRSLNHQYIYEQFVKDINQGQLQIIYLSYLNKTTFENIL